MLSLHPVLKLYWTSLYLLWIDSTVLIRLTLSGRCVLDVSGGGGGGGDQLLQEFRQGQPAHKKRKTAASKEAKAGSLTRRHPSSHCLVFGRFRPRSLLKDFGTDCGDELWQLQWSVHVRTCTKECTQVTVVYIVPVVPIAADRMDTARETCIFLIAVATHLCMCTIMKPQPNTSWVHSWIKSLTRDVKLQDTTLADLQARHVSMQHPHLIQLMAFSRGR